MAEEMQGFGYVSDEDESLQSKARADFGANFGAAVIKSIEYKENVSKEGNDPREAIEMVVLVKDKEEKVWFSPVNKVFGKDGEIGPDHPDYKENFLAAVKQQSAVMTHWFAAAGVSREDLKAAIDKKFPSFKAYAEAAIETLPGNYNQRKLDIFYEYQWNIGTGKDGEPLEKTYPQIPRNMKGGYFVVPAQPGEWTEVRGSDGSLKYVDAEGNEHPFKRTGDFMKSKKGTQQFLDGGMAVDDNPMAGNRHSPEASAEEVE